MRVALRIAKFAAVMLLIARGTAAASNWNPSPKFNKYNCTNNVQDYVSSLEGWPPGTSWQAWLTTCQSTPATFDDGNGVSHTFNSPTRCAFSKNAFGNVDGVWGHFEVPETCPVPYTVCGGCATGQVSGQSTGAVPGAFAVMLGIAVIISIRRRRSGRGEPPQS